VALQEINVKLLAQKVDILLAENAELKLDITKLNGKVLHLLATIHV